jgi:hypothetical protein
MADRRAFGTYLLAQESLMSVHPDSERSEQLPAAPKLPKSGDAEPKASAAKKGRTWRDYVLWAVLAILAVGAVAEFRAQSAYRKALATCNDALNRGEEGKTAGKNEHVKFDDLKASLPSDPVHTQTVHSFAKTEVYTWTWQGVRHYAVHLYVDPKNGEIWDVTSEP